MRHKRQQSCHKALIILSGNALNWIFRKANLEVSLKNIGFEDLEVGKKSFFGLSSNK